MSSPNEASRAKRVNLECSSTEARYASRQRPPRRRLSRHDGPLPRRATAVQDLRLYNTLYPMPLSKRDVRRLPRRASQACTREKAADALAGGAIEVIMLQHGAITSR